MGTKYNKKRDTTVRMQLRIDESMENDLRILYGLDKKSIGGMSFNQWLVLQFHGIIDRNVDKLNIVKTLYEARLVVRNEERNIV
jgi:hypothetical protein